MCPQNLRCPTFPPRSGGSGAGRGRGAWDTRGTSPGCPRPAGVAQDARGLRSRVPSPPQTPLRFFLLLASAAKIMHFLESGRVHFPALKCIQSFAARCQMSPPGSRGAAEPGARSLLGGNLAWEAAKPLENPRLPLSCCIQRRDRVTFGWHSQRRAIVSPQKGRLYNILALF